jgi:D-sedoheptulose 7-phosphate isomerase
VADVNAYLDDALRGHAEAIAAVDASRDAIAAAVDLIAESLAAGGTVYFAGNGGSAADAQHLAAEFVGRFVRERKAWPAQALHANTSALTAIGNDYGFERVFARQIEAFGRAGDVLVGISTSGTSANIVAAIETARELGVRVIGMTGGDGGVIGPLSDVHLNIPVASTARAQEAHILIGHVICGLVEERLCETR